MNNLIFSFLLLIVSYFTGIIGALTGLGGGVIIVPFLVIMLGLDIRYAMGASLISVIATSSGAALTFMQEKYVNLRIGMLFEIGAVLGAMVGAYLVSVFSTSVISVIFGLVLLISIWFTLSRKEEKVKIHKHSIFRTSLGFILMTVAGGLSGLLGIGSGALKVLSLDLAMGLPYKVSTSTSNFMIGMTAAASVGTYLASGFIDPIIAFPVMLGVLVGSRTGAKILVKADTQKLRMLFVVIIFIMAMQMIYKGLSVV